MRDPKIDRLDAVIGQVHALQCFSLAIAMTLRDRDVLRQNLEMSSQIALAYLESAVIGDEAIANFQTTVAKLFAAMQD